MIEEISKSELKTINKATEQIHAAAQFLAMAGKHFAEPKEDDSHTNLGWLTMKEKFISRPFGGQEKIFIYLKPENMEIGFWDSNNNLINQKSLKGCSEKEVSKWIKTQIKELGISQPKFKMDIHYDLPDYARKVVTKFRKSPRKAFIAFAKLRSWAEHYVNKYKLSFPLAQETRTWPHHFDHATYIPLSQLKSGEVNKSMNIGLAIHDGMIGEPYFYVSVWVKNKDLDLGELKPLKAGEWKNESYKGAVLPLSQVIELEDLEKQKSHIDTFLSESIKSLLDHIKYKPTTTNARK